jgi:hypothetical protein
MIRKYTLVISGLFIVVMACRKKADVNPSQCSQDAPKWSHDVVPLLAKYCTDSSFGGCHQSGSQYGDWTDYAQFKYKVDGGHVQEHCLDKDEMPPVYTRGPRPLTASEKQILRCWIEAGAQDN